MSARLGLLMLLLLVCSHPLIAQNIQIKDPHFHQRLATELELYIDPEGKQSLPQLQALSPDQWQPVQQDSLQFGYNRQAYWFRFSVHNQLDSAQRFYLVVRYPLLDQVQVFSRTDRGSSQLQLGDKQPYYQRPYWLNDLVFPLELDAGQQAQLWIRVQSRSTLSIPLYLYSQTSFIEQQHLHSLQDGLYFGMVIALALYNLMLFLFVRRREYLSYVLFVSIYLLSNVTIMGYSFAFWPESLHFQQIAVYAFTIASAMAVAWFGMMFLRTQSQQPGLHRLIQAYLLVSLLVLALLYWLPPEVCARLNAVLMLAGILLLTVAGFRSLRRGYKPALYYLIGQSGVFVSVAFTTLASQNLLPYYYLSPEVLKWGAIFEMLMFSTALAGLLIEERRLRELAQEQLLSLQIERNAELDLKVQQRTEALAAANQKLQQLSVTDELTQIHNRRHFNQVFQTEYQRAFREQQPIALLLLDIDHFKQINDQCGHPFGDRCLIETARLLNTLLQRPCDCLARYGGEEFVMLLPNTSFEGAQHFAQNLLAKIRRLSVQDGQQQRQIRVSIGLVSLIPIERNQHDALLKQADKRLYQAKQQGRDRLVAVNLTPELKKPEHS